MEKIYSKVDPEKLLHVVNRLSDITGRDDIIPEDNFIQCATLKMPKDKTFPPHKHIKKVRHYDEQIAVIKSELDMILDEINLVASVARDLKGDMKVDLRNASNDIRHITEIVNDIEDRQKADTREIFD